MTGFGAFLSKELLETRRTWRIWVIPGMLLFFAITGPLIARLTPALVSSIAGAQPGVVIKLPDPTAVDAYGQFLKNLSQIVTIAVIIAGAGVVSGERSSGTAILVLTKPLTRSAFVAAKLVSQLMLLVGFTALATLVCFAVTRALFPPIGARPLVAATALWLVDASLLVVVMTALSAAFESRGAAAGAGLGFLFLSLLASAWPPPARYSFVGLPAAMGRALGNQPLNASWPVVTAVAVALGFAVLATRLFERKEL